VMPGYSPAPRTKRGHRAVWPRCVAGHDDVVAVTGPALAGDQHAAPVCVDDDLGVDAGAVVLADGVLDWSHTGIRVPSMIQGWVLVSGPGRNVRVSTGTRWWMD
jgi:hypothetical protein